MKKLITIIMILAMALFTVNAFAQEDSMDVNIELLETLALSIDEASVTIEVLNDATPVAYPKEFTVNVGAGNPTGTIVVYGMNEGAYGGSDGYYKTGTGLIIDKNGATYGPTNVALGTAGSGSTPLVSGIALASIPLPEDPQILNWTVTVDAPALKSAVGADWSDNTNLIGATLHLGAQIE